MSQENLNLVKVINQMEEHKFDNHLLKKSIEKPK